MFSIGIGSKTSTGGEVVEGNNGIMMNGLVASSVGHKATCKSGRKECAGIGPIVAVGSRDVNLPAGLAARVGDYVDCGCPPGSNVLVGSSSVQIDNSPSSAHAAPAQRSLSSMDSATSSLSATSNASSTTPTRVIRMNPNHMYWPPYNPSAPEGERNIKIEYHWDLSQQKNISIAVLTVDEAYEYLALFLEDTHGQLSTGKDYAGVGMGLKGAYEVAKELRGWKATAEAVNINGVMHIAIENYTPRYLDLGTSWQAATPQMLKIGYALNTVRGNISFLKGNIFVEIVFSGAVNAVDYMLHNEKTLGEVIGQFTADISKGIVAGVIAHGATLVLKTFVALFFGFTLPTSAVLAVFTILVVKIGRDVSDIDKQYQYTEPMKRKVEEVINDN